MTSYVKANLSIFFLINDQIFKLFARDTFFDRLRVFVWHILLGHHLFLFAEYIWLYQEGFLKHLKAWSWVRILGTSPKGQINKWPHKTLRCPAHSGCDAPNWHSSYGWALEQKRPTFMLGRHLLLSSSDGTRRATVWVKVPSSNPGEATLWCPWLAYSQIYSTDKSKWRPNTFHRKV